MISTQTKLGNALFDGLIKMRQQKGAFSMEDVGTLFMQISATLHSTESEMDNVLKEEIEQLAVFIKQAKNEIATITTSGSGEDSTSSATLHLDAIIKATEEAGHTIMDAADAIQAAANGLGGERQQAIQDAITKIYETCNFQDINSQRVGKVIKILGEIDSRINNTLKLFNAQFIGGRNNNTITNEAKLLSGPQLPDQTPSQADIDALFANAKP